MKENKQIRNDRPQKAKISGASFGQIITSVLGGGILTRKSVMKQLPFLIYTTLLAIIYIANNFAAERQIIKIDRLKKENEVHRFEQILMNSKLMSMSQRSEIINRLKTTGLKESLVPPEKIYFSTPANQH